MVTRTKRLEEPVSFPKDDSEWHSFLDGHVEDALTIRDYVDELPETAATFSLSRIDGLNSPIGSIPNGCVYITGAWKVPEILTNTGAQKWVNPNYQYAQHYSDAVVECECGIPVLRESFGPNEKQPAHHQEHKDHCTKINRVECQLQLLKNRRDIVTEAYEFGHTMGGVHHRLGYSRDKHLGGYECEQLGLDIEALGKRARRKFARTALVLCREYSPKVVGKLFDMHPRSVSSVIRQETKSDTKALYSVRRSTA